MNYLPADFVPGQREHFELRHHREVLGRYSGHLTPVQVEFLQSDVGCQSHSVLLSQSNQAGLKHQLSDVGSVVAVRNRLQGLSGLYLMISSRKADGFERKRSESKQKWRGARSACKKDTAGSGFLGKGELFLPVCHCLQPDVPERSLSALQSATAEHKAAGTAS